MSKQTLILIIILFFFTAGLLILALNKPSHNLKRAILQPITPVPTINSTAPDTSLLFGDLQLISKNPTFPNLATPSADMPTTTSSATKIPATETKTYLIPIIIKTGANKVTTVQLELSYDPFILTNVNITPSNFFENPAIFIHQIDDKNGRISYALGATPSDAGGGKQGEGVLAILTFQTTVASDATTATFDVATVKFETTKTASEASETKLSKQTSITFLPKTFVIAQGPKQSALKSTNSAQLKFANVLTHEKTLPKRASLHH